MSPNPLGMKGFAFLEISTEDTAAVRAWLYDLGFSWTHRGRVEGIEGLVQNNICILVNDRDPSAGLAFSREHGPTVSAMGWAFEDPAKAHAAALTRGAKDATETTAEGRAPAIFGIGGTRIYFVKATEPAALFQELGLREAPFPQRRPALGFLCVDHLTNNVAKGTMAEWRKFYQEIFGFTDVRTFDIRGQKTDLQSYALRSPDGSFCIPINEAQADKSQINEYLERHRGPGIQHIAFLTRDLLSALDQMKGSEIETLDIAPHYYDTAFSRAPGLKESRERIRSHNVLVDGDEKGYLLQIFTKDLLGPIFIELIQRENHLSFGEGNFQALFESIERDQERRGVL